MEYYIARDGQRSGPFSQEEVRRKLASGEISLTDRGWQEGMAEWMPLTTFPMLVAPSTPVLMPMGGGTSMYQPVTTSGMAVASLVLGIISITLFPILPSLLAVIFGHAARSSIRHSQGRLVGDGLAVAGLVLGYLGVGILVAMFVMLFIFMGFIGFAAVNAK